jgi:hypothetical protein
MPKVQVPASFFSLPLILIVAAACYFPFVNKAVHIDSDMLVHSTRQFLINPVNPPLGEYGVHMAQHDTTGMPKTSVFYRIPHGPLLSLYLMPIAAIA